MLYLLTGDIQNGKTRWLQALVGELEKHRVPVAGVLAPGIWRESPTQTGAYEKLGIDNVLLPGGERLAFARRREDVPGQAAHTSCTQSESERLRWAMSDEAITRVNGHFANLAASAPAPGAQDGLLVVDELGRLELMRGLGLTAAMKLLLHGPRPGWPHAIVVVRSWLLPRAHELLDDAWAGEVRETAPNDAAREELLGLYA